MNATKQVTWLFSALIILAFLGWYCASSSPTQLLDDDTLAKTIDTIVLNLTVRRFDERGQLVHYLETPKMEHLPYNNSYFFEMPYLSLKQSEQPWEIKAQKAIALNNGEEINFLHHVIVHQPATATNTASTMKTEKLIYFPKQKIASTDVPVDFYQTGTVVHSQGMKAYFNDKRVLLSKARAVYEPKQSG